MSEDRLPKRIIYEELLQGQRYVDGHKKYFQDNLKLMRKFYGVNLAERKLEQTIATVGGHYAVCPLKDLKLAELKIRNFADNNAMIA